MQQSKSFPRHYTAFFHLSGHKTIKLNTNCCFATYLLNWKNISIGRNSKAPGAKSGMKCCSSPALVWPTAGHTEWAWHTGEKDPIQCSQKSTQRGRRMWSITKYNGLLNKMGQGNVPFTFNEFRSKKQNMLHTHVDMILWLNVIQKFYAKPDKIREWTVKNKNKIGLHRQIIVSARFILKD